ncbi:hypothetical protein D9619_011062 [Psilocybe cf. subviscida]|uniref:F-box domain-containing protein n=1 Tax=Psilocybe cf. subviscida TaxID=2480587 RepID=A0A8H5F0H5_9AGAR|nr:hypothetical protein D9619_011062 [Psilocybe cf. subviscida]
MTSTTVQSRRPNSVVDRLPFDILHEIFQLHSNDISWDIRDYSDASTAGYKSRLAAGYNPLDSATTISHVCRGWRADILRMPAIWGRLMDTEYFRDSEEWWWEVLRRTGSTASLWIRCCTYPPWVQNKFEKERNTHGSTACSKPLVVSKSRYLLLNFVLPVLSKQGSRVVRVHLSPHRDAYWGIGSGHWRGLGSLTNVQFVIFSMAHDITEKNHRIGRYWVLNPAARFLTEWILTNHHSFLPRCDISRLTTLHLIAAELPLNVVLGVLRHSSSLEELRIDGPAQLGVALDKYELDKVLPLTECDQLDLPHLRRVEIISHFPLAVITLPRIRSLGDKVYTIKIVADLSTHFDEMEASSLLSSLEQDLPAFAIMLRNQISINVTRWSTKEQQVSGGPGEWWESEVDMSFADNNFSIKLGTYESLVDGHEIEVNISGWGTETSHHWLLSFLHTHLVKDSPLNGVKNIDLTIAGECLKNYGEDICQLLLTTPSIRYLRASPTFFAAFVHHTSTIKDHSHSREPFSELKCVAVNSNDLRRFDNPNAVDIACIVPFVWLLDGQGIQLDSLSLEAFMVNTPADARTLEDRVMDLIPVGSVKAVDAWVY